MNRPEDSDPEMSIQGFDAYVVIDLPGYIFSRESQELRDQIEAWFIEHMLLVGFDVDFLYCDNGRETSRGSYEQLNSIAVWFKDPKKAILFKLVFG